MATDTQEAPSKLSAEDIEALVKKLNNLVSDSGDSETACTIDRIRETFTTMRSKLGMIQYSVFGDAGVEEVTLVMCQECDRLEVAQLTLSLAERQCDALRETVELLRSQLIHRLQHIRDGAE